MTIKSAILLALWGFIGALPAPAQEGWTVNDGDLPEVSFVAVSSDGWTAAVSYSNLPEVLIVDLLTGLPVRRLVSFEAPVSFVCFDEDKGRLITLAGQEVSLWDLDDYQRKEKFSLQIYPEPDGNKQAFSECYYDPSRELLFCSFGSDLYCYSLRREGLAKVLKAKGKTKKIDAASDTRLTQSPARTELWALDLNVGELRVIELNNFREQKRTAAPGALAMAVNNQQIAVLRKPENDGGYLLDLYDHELEKANTISVTERLPAGSVLKLAFTGLEQVSLTGHQSLIDINIRTGVAKTFDFGLDYDALFYQLDGRILLRKETHLHVLNDWGREEARHPLSFETLLLRDADNGEVFFLNENSLLDQDGNLVFSLSEEDRFFLSASLQKGSLALSRSDGKISLYDVKRGELIRRINGINEPFGRLLALPGSGRIAGFVPGDRKAYLLDWKSGELVQRLPATGGKITSLTAGDQFILIGDEGGQISVFQLSDGELKNRYAPVEGGITTLALLPDGQRVAAGGKAGIRFYSFPGLEPSGELIGHDNAIRRIQFSDGSNHMLSIAGDGIVRVWDLDAAVVQNLLPPYEDTPRDAAFLPGRSMLAVLTEGGRVILEPLENTDPSNDFREIASRAIGMPSITHCAFSLDGSFFVTSNEGRIGIDIWSAKTGTKLRTIIPADGLKPGGFFFFSDQDVLVVYGGPGIQYWDIETGQLLKEIDYTAAHLGFEKIAKEPGRDRFWGFLPGSDKVFILDSHTGDVLHNFNLEAPAAEEQLVITDMAFSPDGATLGFLCSGAVYLFDPGIGKPVAFIKDPQVNNDSHGYFPRFSPGGRILVYALPGGEITVMDLYLERELFRAPGQAFTLLDNQRMAVARKEPGGGTSIDIWNYMTGEPLATFNGESSREINGMAFHPVWRILAGTGRRGNVIFWKAEATDKVNMPEISREESLDQLFPLRPEGEEGLKFDFAIEPYLFFSIPFVAEPDRGREAPSPVRNEIREVIQETSLRSGAGSSHQVLVRLPKGAAVTLVEDAGDPYWIRVRYDGKAGWAKRALLRNPK